MFKNYISIAIRSMRKHTGYALINLFGLAIGMAAMGISYQQFVDGGNIIAYDLQPLLDIHL